jgi:hypothetical protein
VRFIDLGVRRRKLLQLKMSFSNLSNLKDVLRNWQFRVNLSHFVFVVLLVVLRCDRGLQCIAHMLFDAVRVTELFGSLRGCWDDAVGICL